MRTLAILILAAALPGEIPVTTKSPDAQAAFRAGREKALNFQNVEAADLFKKALSSDADFPLALAWLGKVTPGPQGLALIERAVALASQLPEAERKSIDVILAERWGEDEKARLLKREIAVRDREHPRPRAVAGVRRPRAAVDLRKADRGVQRARRRHRVVKPGAKCGHSCCVGLGMEAVMGARKLVFPIALAIVWVVMTAMAMVDFASFTEATRVPAAAALHLGTRAG